MALILKIQKLYLIHKSLSFVNNLECKDINPNQHYVPHLRVMHMDEDEVKGQFKCQKIYVIYCNQCDVITILCYFLLIAMYLNECVFLTNFNRVIIYVMIIQNIFMYNVIINAYTIWQLKTQSA